MTTNENYFNSLQKRNEEIKERFDKLLKRFKGALDGLYYEHVISKDPNNFSQKLYFRNPEGAFSNSVVDLNLNIISGVFTAMFKVIIDNQSRIELYVSSSTKVENWIILNFDNFTDDTERDLGFLIKDYFERGVAAVIEILSKRVVSQ